MNKNKRKNILHVRQKDTYTDLCAMCACKSLNIFMDEYGLKIEDIDLVISSQSPEGFINRMKSIPEFADKFVEFQISGKKTMHTAGPAFALKKAFDENLFRVAKHIIFLTVGSGINVSLAHYLN